MNTATQVPSETMTSRQRVLKAINHETPDRVPIDLGGNQTGIHSFAYEALLKHLGIRDDVTIMDAVQQLARPCEAVLERFHVDTRYIAAQGPAEFPGRDRAEPARRAAVARPPRRVRRRLVDARRPAVLHGHLPSSAGQRDRRRHRRAIRFPRATIRAGSTGLRERALQIRNETPYAVVSGISGVVYETCWYLRGLERWFMDLLTEPDFCEALLDQTLKFWLDWFRLFLDEVGDVVDVIMIGDDLAGQTGPLFRPEIYRAMVKPRQKRLVQYIRSRTKAKIWYHTCGSCIEYIPDLLDNGIDILNPVQVSAKDMDPAALKSRFGDRLVFWGGGDRCPARLAVGLAGSRPPARAPQRRGLEARRRLRLQQRPQHPGRRAARRTSWPCSTPRMSSASTAS